MIKKVLVVLTAISGFHAAADIELKIKVLDTKSVVSMATKIAQDGESVLPFKVGETADYTLNLGGFLNGTMNMLVREETSEGVWLEQNIDLQIQKQKVETLFDKTTGQVKKVLVDGKEQKMEEGGEAPEIVESKPDTVTVPKGTFECSYVKIRQKTEQGTSDTELWVNPELVPIMGLIKLVSQTQIGPMTLELADFKKL